MSAAEAPEVTQEHITLVTQVVMRHFSTSRPYHSELISEGMVALAEAQQTYDPTKGMTFRNWAGRTIQHRLIDYIRTQRGRTEHASRARDRVALALSIDEVMAGEGDDDFSPTWVADPSPAIEDLIEARDVLRRVRKPCVCSPRSSSASCSPRSTVSPTQRLPQNST
jgi:RNA polymerase sigma factor (sigma-70 family)